MKRASLARSTMTALALLAALAWASVLVGSAQAAGVAPAGTTKQWALRDINTTGAPNASFTYGLPGDIAIVGDWNGDGIDTPGVVRGNTWYLRNSNSIGVANLTFSYGMPGDIPIVGDWNGDGIDTPGISR